MKKLLVVLTLIFMPFCIFSQQMRKQQPLEVIQFRDNVKLPLTSHERAQIDEVYGEFADKFVYSNPYRLKSVKNILRNRVVIELLSEDKKECTKLSEVSVLRSFVSDLKRDKIFEPKNFNPLKYNFKFHSRSAAMYHVDNTNYYIIIKSQYQ